MAQDSPQAKYTEQNILNRSYDQALGLLLFLSYGWDGQTAQRRLADCLSTKITVDGNVTYIASAKPGSSESDPVWQVKKIDESDGVRITWADGGNFTQIATDLTTLIYS